jgi:hypothetical protein
VTGRPSLSRRLFLAPAPAPEPYLRFNGTEGTTATLWSRRAGRDAPIAGSWIDKEGDVPVCVIGVARGEYVCQVWRWEESTGETDILRALGTA